MRKSLCCGVVVWRFGKRRRRCSLCKKTWRAHFRRQGRKQKRQRPRFSLRVITENRSLRSLAENDHSGREKIRKRFHRSLESLIRISSRISLSKNEPLIAIADALHTHCEKHDIIIPIILLRPVNSEEAKLELLDALNGGESERNWRRAFKMINPEIRSRISALVSDDCLGLVKYARSQNWQQQLCVFHLKARFRAILGRKKNIKFRKERHLAWKLVNQVATETNLRKLGPLIRELRKLGRKKKILKILRIHVNGFLRNWRDYRAYLEYPQLNLPSTTNSAETIANFTKQMLRQRRGFRTTKSLKVWLKTVKILHPEVACKRANYTPN